jgi:hypothetical protein
MAGVARRGPTSRGRARPLVWGSASALLLLAVSVATVLLMRNRDVPQETAASAVPVTITAAPTVPAEALRASLVPPSPASEPMPTPAASHAPVRPRGAPVRGTHPPDTTTSSPPKACDPPFVVDATGTKRWKVECL